MFEAAGENDEIALEVVDYVAKHLGLVLGNLASSLNPSKIVLGGGVSRAGELLRSKVEKTFRKCAFPRAAQAADISIAALGNDAGVIGGAWIAKNEWLKHQNC